ncbi:MAG TPA: hypothetical protein VF804_07960 [Holophagaceae bacterium]
MIPQKYIIATLFIAAMLLLFAVVQAPRPVTSGGVTATEAPVVMSLGAYDPVTDFQLEDGWSPRFQGTVDPDQAEPWPYAGGFGTPWEPASPYLADQGLALNGPKGVSEVVLWRGLEWRHYRFDAPLCSARLDPAKGTRLLVTLQMGPDRFETRLLEVPEGRVLWSAQSGPWSRFSWDGRAALFGFFEPSEPKAEARLLLTTLPLDSDLGETTLAAWDEPGLPAPLHGWPVKPEGLSDDGRDLPGAKVVLPWHPGDRLWCPQADRLWVSGAQGWTAWSLEKGRWRRSAAGPGLLVAHPPVAMALTEPLPGGGMGRRTTPPGNLDWTPVPADAPPWPAYDAAWVWVGGGVGSGAFDAWDRRWGNAGLAPERQRQAVTDYFRAEWRTGLELRASVKGWLPAGPEVAMREGQGVAWVWVGTRIVLVHLVEVERLHALRKVMRP